MRWTNFVQIKRAPTSYSFVPSTPVEYHVFVSMSVQNHAMIDMSVAVAISISSILKKTCIQVENGDRGTRN